VPQSVKALSLVLPQDLDDAHRRHRELLSQLRVLDHWRRLVNARLDLAVAAVTDIDDAGLIDDGLIGDSLRDLIGIPRQHGRLAESAKLVLLREVLRDLDAVRGRLQLESAGLSRILLADSDPFAE
jgi:hypothetical protein